MNLPFLLELRHLLCHAVGHWHSHAWAFGLKLGLARWSPDSQTFGCRMNYNTGSPDSAACRQQTVELRGLHNHTEYDHIPHLSALYPTINLLLCIYSIGSVALDEHTN